MDDLLDEFLTECLENLGVLDNEVVRLERNPEDPELIGSIFRIVHTIKGTCGFLGLPRLESIAHAAENVLGRFREGDLPVTPGSVSLVLEALDRIKWIIGELEARRAEPAGDDNGLIARLERLAEDGELPAPPAVEGQAVAPVGGPAVHSDPREPEAGESAGAPRGGARGQQSLRVSVEILEDMMTLVSELVLTRNQLMQMVRQEAESAFKAPLQRLSQITSELQDGVMTTRMQPIGNAWSTLPRVVRDLGLELGKQIELTMTGQETELDRQVLELIKDPLTHMVRNSADHGIETPADRRAAGKPGKGTISLNAYHEGGHIMIEIADDGRGLDVARIGAKAVVSGLVSEAELQAMSPQQIQQFIFRPGFSTAGRVTNISGRGVGMDVVRSNIERIGGTIELNAQAGRGTRFIVKIPLTLAIIAALIVEAGGERFAIPQISVLELVRAGTRTEHQVEVVGGALLLRLRERLLPLMPLAGLLGLREDDALQTAAEAHVVVCQVGAAMLGLIVDRVFDTEEIVVKPVAPLLRGVNAFSGNTILGDGGVVMILDLNGLVAASGAAVAETTSEAEATTVVGSTVSLLLFRGGYGAPKAVPLALVTRIEEAAAEAVELASGRLVMQYRGCLMPLSTLDGQPVSITEGRRPVLVFGDGERTVGLVVDEIIDVAEQRIEIAQATDQPWCLGSVIIGGRTVDLIDVGAVVAGLFGSFEAAEGKPERARPETGRRLLLVDDSAFFRHMLEPVLMASGYEVVTVDSPAAALRLRDRGEAFDVIISDIEMPEMDGFAFAAACRSEGAWQEVPIVALSSHTAEADLARAREAGFSDYVAKLDRSALLATLRQSMALSEEAAA